MLLQTKTHWLRVEFKVKGTGQSGVQVNVEGDQIKLFLQAQAFTSSLANPAVFLIALQFNTQVEFCQK